MSEMNFPEAVRSAFSNYVNFSGRATRPQFWWWVLFVFIVVFVLGMIDGAIVAPMLGAEAFSEDASQPLSLIAALGLFLPNLAVSVRRLHDIGKSGWWILIGLIPVLGLLVLIYWYVQPGEAGQNQFG